MASAGAGDRLGPTELLVIEFPRGEVRLEGVATLSDLVARGIISVLEVQFVRRTGPGTVEQLTDRRFLGRRLVVLPIAVAA